MKAPPSGPGSGTGANNVSDSFSWPGRVTRRKSSIPAGMSTIIRSARAGKYAGPIRGFSLDEGHDMLFARARDAVPEPFPPVFLRNIVMVKLVYLLAAS